MQLFLKLEKLVLQINCYRVKYLIAKNIVPIEAIVETKIALIIFSGLTLYAAHKTIEVTPQGATLTKKAPGISAGNPALKNTNPINNKIIGEITNFKTEIDTDNLLITFLV